MNRTSLLVCLAVLLAGRAAGAPTPSANEQERTDARIVVSAAALAQAVQDDVNVAAKKYHLTELQIDGVVTKQSEYKGQVSSFQFDLKVTDRKSGEVMHFTIFFGLEDPLAKGDKSSTSSASGRR